VQPLSALEPLSSYVVLLYYVAVDCIQALHYKLLNLKNRKKRRTSETILFQGLSATLSPREGSFSSLFFSAITHSFLVVSLSFTVLFFIFKILTVKTAKDEQTGD